jgi:hypothetical protein
MNPQEQLLQKIVELLQELIALQKVPKNVIYFQHDQCKDNGPHEYPNPWLAVIPPHCAKCGKLAQNSFTITNGTDL